MECEYCSAVGDDVCRTSIQAGQCDRRIKQISPPTTARRTNPKDQFFLAAADLCRSLKHLVDIEIAHIEKEKR